MKAFAVFLILIAVAVPSQLCAKQDDSMGDVARRTKAERESYHKAHPNVKTRELSGSTDSQSDNEVDPTGAKELVDKGLQLDRQGHFEEALAFYYKALKLRPDYERAYYDIGVVYDELDRPTAAIAAYKKAISIDDSREAAFLNIGLALKATGQDAEAEEYYKKGLDKFPNNICLMMNLGNLLAGQRKFEEAIPYFRRILDLAPEKNNARQSLCYSLLQLGRREEAAKVRAEWPDYVPNQN